MSHRTITVCSCNGCPFAHRERRAPDTFYCAIDAKTPTVTHHMRPRTKPDTCPALTATFHVSAHA